jgi:hypothetical protein
LELRVLFRAADEGAPLSLFTLCLELILLWRQQSEEDEPGSVTYNELMWRRQRNEKILDATDHQAGVARESVFA